MSKVHIVLSDRSSKSLADLQSMFQLQGINHDRAKRFGVVSGEMPSHLIQFLIKSGLVLSVSRDEDRSL